jgi:hypothetical protein
VAHCAVRLLLAQLHHALPLDGMIVNEVINYVLPFLILKEVLILLILIVIDGLSVSPRLRQSRPDLSRGGDHQSLMMHRRILGYQARTGIAIVLAEVQLVFHVQARLAIDFGERPVGG